MGEGAGGYVKRREERRERKEDPPIERLEIGPRFLRSLSSSNTMKEIEASRFDSVVE